MHVVFLFATGILHGLIIKNAPKNEFNGLNSICFVFSKCCAVFFLCFSSLYTKINVSTDRLTLNYFIECCIHVVFGSMLR